MTFLLCVPRERGRSPVSLSFLIMSPILRIRVPHFWPHLTVTISLEALSPNIVTLEVKSSTYAFGGDTIQSINVHVPRESKICLGNLWGQDVYNDTGRAQTWTEWMDMEDIRGIRNYRTRKAWPTDWTLTSSSAETKLHSLKNFLERLSPSFPAFLCPSPAPLVWCTLTWLAAGKCKIIIELFCTEGLFTSGWLMLIITALVTKSVGLRWGEAPQLGLLLTASPAKREVRTKTKKGVLRSLGLSEPG